MAGYVIATIACVLPFALGASGLGRPRVVVGVGGLLAAAWLIGGAIQGAPTREQVPLWFFAGLVVLLYAIWCGGLWLGVRLRRIRRTTPG